MKLSDAKQQKILEKLADDLSLMWTRNLTRAIRMIVSEIDQRRLG